MCIGVDLHFPQASDAQVSSFVNSTGATYLFLKDGGNPVGYDMDDLVTGYGERDNYVVISRSGIIRFNAIQEFPVRSQRYFRDRIRACVDSLLLAPYVGVDDRIPSTVWLAIQPNPFTGSATVEFASPFSGTPARVTVHDIAGRQVATLWEGPAPLGVTRVTWDGKDSGGRSAPAGVYVVRAAVGPTTRTVRVVRVH